MPDQGTPQNVGDDGCGFLLSHYTVDASYMDLQDASRLDTAPAEGLDSPLGSPMEENASFAAVVCRAAETLDLQLPSVETKMNILTKIIPPGPGTSELLLPFNEALTDTFTGTCWKPCSCPPV